MREGREDVKPVSEEPVLAFADGGEWRQWLEERHGSGHAVWLLIAKKNSGVRGISYADAVEGALCYGWIDGRANRYDDRFWMQRFTPRRPGSQWSEINRERAEDLVERGLMRPSGLAQVESARADGRWPRG